MNDEVKTEPVEAVYIAPETPTFKFKMFRDEKKEMIEFVKGEYRTSDPYTIAFIDDLVATRVQFSSTIRKVDRAAALELAMKHQSLGIGVTGTLSAADVVGQAHRNLELRDAQLAEQSGDPVAMAAMNEQIAADSLQMTVKGDTTEQPVAPSQEFLDKQAEAAETAETLEPAPVKTAFAALAKKE